MVTATDSKDVDVCFGGDTIQPAAGKNKGCTFKKQKVAGVAGAKWMGSGGQWPDLSGPQGQSREMNSHGK